MQYIISKICIAIDNIKWYISTGAISPCTIETDYPQQATQDPMNSAEINLPLSFGTNLELLDNDSDQAAAESRSTSSAFKQQSGDTLLNHITLQHDIMVTLLLIN